MRAARLLHILVLLQNRGRLTAGALAGLLEVSPRTVLRDVEAMAEAGLPVVSHRGQGGGIALDEGPRVRMLALTGEEAEALGLALALPHPALGPLGLAGAAARAMAKLGEALPEPLRRRVAGARPAFDLRPEPPAADPRLAALATAVREGRMVRIDLPRGREVHPVGLRLDGEGWSLLDAISGEAVPEVRWGRINVSARRFAAGTGDQARGRRGDRAAGH